MPQMSPLGWIWLVLFVTFGYVMYLVIFYSMFLNIFGFSFYKIGLGEINWLW